MTEYAMVQTTNGTPVRRDDAQQSLEKFKRALATRGGSMPSGMCWNEGRGFYRPGAPLTLAEATERQRQVARAIDYERTRLEMRPGLAALAAKLDRAMR